MSLGLYDFNGYRQIQKGTFLPKLCLILPDALDALSVSVNLTHMAWQKNQIHQDFLRRMPAKEAEVVQIETGQMNFRSIEVWGRETFILKFASDALSSFTASPHLGWIGLLIPVSWTGAFRINGVQHEPNRAYYLDGGHDYTVACQNSTRILVGVRRNVINARISEISGNVDGNLLWGSRIFDNCAEYTVEMEHMISSLQADGKINADHFEGTNLSKDQEGALVETMAHLFLDKLAKPTPAWLGQIEDYHITTTIRNAINIRPISEHLQLNDLYKIAGVGKNRLHQSFVNVYCASPMRYLNLRRLWLARAFLLNPENADCMIGDVSSQFGYASSGRFAKNYQAIFHEFPRDTFKRAKSMARRD